MSTTLSILTLFQNQVVRCNMGLKSNGKTFTPTQQLHVGYGSGTQSSSDSSTIKFNKWSSKGNALPKCWMTTNTLPKFDIDIGVIPNDTCFLTIPQETFNALSGKNNGYNKDIVFKCEAKTDSNGIITSYSGSFVDK